MVAEAGSGAKTPKEAAERAEKRAPRLKPLSRLSGWAEGCALYTL